MMKMMSVAVIMTKMMTMTTYWSYAVHFNCDTRYDENDDNNDDNNYDQDDEDDNGLVICHMPYVSIDYDAAKWWKQWWESQ